jgi:pimeloyl-ACP methyl ester carboxylesterase
MSTFVLVHGAWQGTSTWDLVVPKLQTSGHTVFTPVLTGLGQDSQRLSPSVNLDTHIDDVTGILKCEDLRSVTLVGHSYAGMVITGVAEKESVRLGRLIYVDAFVPDNESSALDLLPEAIQESFRQEAREKRGRLAAPGTRESFGSVGFTTWHFARFCAGPVV